MKNKKWKIDPISLFSHELKTPLSCVKLGLALLEEDFEKHKEVLPLMKGELDRLIDFITDNLDLRIIKQNQDLFQWKWEEFDPLISNTCSSLSRIAQKEKVFFDIQKTSPAPVELLMDASWIYRLLENLLSNALRFAPKNTSILIKYGLNDQDQLYCCVQDEGPGISNPEKLFDLFYKTPSNKKNIKNTGLGLSICKAIVQAHGGQISTSPKKSKGSVFYFTLPKARLLKQSA